MALPVAAGLALWFAYPAKVLETWRSLVNQPWGVRNAFGVEGLLFYPRAFVSLCGSGWLAAAFAAAVLAGVRRWRDPRVRLLVVLVTVQFGIVELHQTKLSRYLLPMFPAVYLLAGLAGAALWHGSRAASAGIRRWAPRIVVVALAVHSAVLPSRIAPPGDSPEFRSLAREIAPVIRPPAVGLAVVSWGFCLPCLDWSLLAQEKALAPQQAITATQRVQAAKLAAALHGGRVPSAVAGILLPTLDRYTGKAELPTVEIIDPLTPELFARLAQRQDLQRLAILSRDAETPGRIGPLGLVSSKQVEIREHGPFAGEAGALRLRLNIYRR